MTTTPDPTDPGHRRDETVRHAAVGDGPRDDTDRYDTSRYDSTRYDTGRYDTPTSETSSPEPTRPTGPSWPTIALGVLALVVSGMALTYQLVDLDVDWTLATPVAIVSAGALLVLLGLVGLLGNRGEEEPR